MIIMIVIVVFNGILRARERELPKTYSRRQKITTFHNNRITPSFSAALSCSLETFRVLPPPINFHVQL